VPKPKNLPEIKSIPAAGYGAPEQSPAVESAPLPQGNTTASEGAVRHAVTDLRDGDGGKESFRVLFDHFFPQVQRFYAKRVFSAEDRLDLTQETFLRIYKGIGGYRGEAQLGTWVFRIAYNTWLQWLRKEGGHETISVVEIDGKTSVWDEEERALVSLQPSPLESTLDDERHNLLKAAVERLPEKMRQCTRLRIYQDLNYREIATTMRLSIETVKVHLFQARKKLRQSLQDIDF